MAISGPPTPRRRRPSTAARRRRPRGVAASRAPLDPPLCPPQAKAKERKLRGELKAMFEEKGALAQGGRGEAGGQAQLPVPAAHRTLPLSTLPRAPSGAPFDEAWRVDVKVRMTGSATGTSDAVRWRRGGGRRLGSAGRGARALPPPPLLLSSP